MVTSPSSAATTMINIGFKPKYIVVMYYINSSNHIECVYNENITSSLQFRTGSQYAVPYSSKSNLHIGSITDNGFTIITGDGAISRSIPIYYFAAK